MVFYLHHVVLKLFQQPGKIRQIFDETEQAKRTMDGWIWTFKNGDWTYIGDDAEMGDDHKNCGLFFELSFKDELKYIIKLKEIK